MFVEFFASRAGVTIVVALFVMCIIISAAISAGTGED